MKSRPLLFAAALAAVALALFCPPRGEVFFTGLDDSVQCALSKGLALGMPLLRHDDKFAAVPEQVRPALLYRPLLSGKTRDMAHIVDPETFESRPFFQPFLPLQRAFLPGLPVVLALAVLACVACLAAPSRNPRAMLLAAASSLAVALLTPWPARFCFSPFSEGVATLFAALGLALSCRSPRGSMASCAALGAMEGLCLGLSATFHPTLVVYATPIAVFAIMRAGRPSHALALAFGAALGLAPLVWSTKCVTAPYGDFFSISALMARVKIDKDIRSFVLALSCVAPFAVSLLCLAFSRRARAFASREGVALALATICATAAAGAIAAAVALPGLRSALLRDLDGFAFALPAIAALCAAAFARRRPAACFVIAALSAAALPSLAVQGNEVHVGIWSLRRALPFMALLPLAAFLGAFDADGAPCRAAKWLPRTALALVFACAAIQLVRLPAAYGGGGETGARALVESAAARMRPGSLYLFARISDAATFAANPELEVFGLNDKVSNAIGHEAVANWLRDESRRRPTYVVALEPVSRPIADNGMVLCPEGEPISGNVSRAYGNSFGRMGAIANDRAFSFLRVHAEDSPEGAAALRGGVTLRPGVAMPFGMAPGGWDVPRKGKKGRWACDGAAFWGPVPAPGEKIEIEFSASWWTRDGTNSPPQSLRVEPPFPCAVAEGAVARLPASPSFQQGRWTVERPATDAVARPATGLYRIHAAERYDERGFLPALAACFEDVAVVKKATVY